MSRPRQTTNDADALRRTLRKAGAAPVIPGRVSRKRKVAYDKGRYRERHLVENAFCRLKDWRRIATRYDKLDQKSAAGGLKQLYEVAGRVCQQDL